MELITTDHRIPPARGVICAENRRGAPLAPVDLQRWLRLTRTAFKTGKVEVIASERAYSLLPALLEAATTLEVQLSLRTSSPPPSNLAELKNLGLGDVTVILPPRGHDQLSEWLDAAGAAQTPLRVQCMLPAPPDCDPMQFAQNMANSNVCAVNLALFDPLATEAACGGPDESRATLGFAAAAAEALITHGVEVNILGIPFCLLDKSLWPHVVNRPQFHLDHQQYERSSYELARRFFEMGPIRAKKAILMLLGRHTSFPNPIDNILLPWIMDNPWLRARIWAWHKLTRHLRLIRSAPKAIDPTIEAHEAALQRREAERAHELGPECGQCALRSICDRDSAALRAALPGAKVKAVAGECHLWPLHFASEQPKYYDALDATRRDAARIHHDLAEEARETLAHRRPDRTVESFEYEVEGEWSWQLAGILRWFSWTNTEKISTPLERLEPPFTLAVTFGGGVAEFIGFSLGRQCKLVCPMTAYNHRVTLHVAEDGRYVLLRDEEPVHPVEFAGQYYAPTLIRGVIEPRISIWNIDGAIGTQAVSIWKPEQEERHTSTARFSVVMVSTRFARRLQASLVNLANQQGLAPGELEVIVAHVPGVDATGDLLDSMELTFPHLRVVRAPFSGQHVTSKGFMINESVRMASGEWVVLLDADIILPPDFFERLAKAPDEAAFAVPDGRKMLTPQTTAAVLLGAVKPWEAWGDLLRGAGEYRRSEGQGAAVGFCQIVRRHCFERVCYEEMNHFEGADWKFGKDMAETFGKEYRLSGAPVLHLDHGSSQWYGTPQHR